MSHDLAKAERALDLACKLHEVARSVPVQVDTLLNLIEPPAQRLRTLKDGEHTEPAEAAAFLRSLDSRFRKRKRLQKALAELIPSEDVRERIAACRVDLREFYERIAKIPKARRRGELKDSLRAELKKTYSVWPVSAFTQELLNDSIDDLLRRTLGDPTWFVTVPKDDVHTVVRERLKRVERVSPDAASPLDVWQLCPDVCADCWYCLKDRMRKAIRRLAEMKSNARSEQLKTGGKVRMHGKDVADRLGTSEGQFSRWRNRGVVPAWAQSEPERFRRLILAGRKKKVPLSNVNELEVMRHEWTESAVKAAGRGQER